jgi:saccharopine dehydrogenase-like NADP-dependent oxidoreductase
LNYDFVVLGALGMQGKIVCRDLLEKGYSVLLIDREKPLSRTLLNQYKQSSTFILADINDTQKIRQIIKRSCADVVVNCAEDDVNLKSLKTCIESGVHCIDLGSTISMTKKQLKMDKALKEKNLIHITGCGSVPGIGNVMLRYASEKLDKIHTVEVGFVWDSNIKEFVVPFSIESVAYEFTHHATILENGKFVKKIPMQTVEECNHKLIGKQKCFLAEHSEPYTFYHYFAEKGLKNVRFYAGFPDHSFKTIKTIINLGLNKSKKIELKKTKIKPIDFLTAVLRRLDVPQGYKESESLWIRVFGQKDDKDTVIEMECVASTLDGWEDAGCNIDTGIPASIIAQMIKKGIITQRGSFAPEGIVPVMPFFEELAKKQMIVYENNKPINKPINKSVVAIPAKPRLQKIQN